MGMSKDRCPYNSFFGEKEMIKEKLSLIWGKFVNRETISYLIFGVLTTLVDWISYAVFRHNGMHDSAPLYLWGAGAGSNQWERNFCICQFSLR